MEVIYYFLWGVSGCLYIYKFIVCVCVCIVYFWKYFFEYRKLRIVVYFKDESWVVGVRGRDLFLILFFFVIFKILYYILCNLV